MKRSFNLLALSVKLVELMYLLAVTIGINPRQDVLDGGRPVRKLVLYVVLKKDYVVFTRVVVVMENNGKSQR